MTKPKQLKATSSLLLTAILFSTAILSPFAGSSQQQVDNEFVPVVETPLFERGKGPVLLIDGGHHNFHTLADKFAPFGRIAAMDGFQVRDIPGEIGSGTLKDANILVIANALNAKNADSWQVPVHPAFTPEEVKRINDWVWSGGRLLLIADHMPFPGAVNDLAQSMGFSMENGFAFCKPGQTIDVFSYANGMLRHNSLTDLHGSLDSIVSFTGQAFRIPDSAVSVITLDSSYKVLLPDVAWEFSKKTKMIPAEGLSQLAYSRYGKGKVIVAGEAAMFTAQKAGEFKFGLNAPIARSNLSLLLNMLEWLNE